MTSSTDVTSIPNPVNSLLIYNTSTIEDVTTGFYFWATNKWVKITTELEGSWKNNTTKEFATSNYHDIYQLGKVGIGNSIVNYPLDFGETSAVNLNDETAKKIALSSLNDGRDFWGLGASEGSLNIFAGDNFSGGKGAPFAVFTNDHEFIIDHIFLLHQLSISFQKSICSDANSSFTICKN